MPMLSKNWTFFYFSPQYDGPHLRGRQSPQRLRVFGPVRLDIEFSLEKAKKELSRKHERLKARKRMIGGCPRTHQSCHFERSEKSYCIENT